MPQKHAIPLAIVENNPWRTGTIRVVFAGKKQLYRNPSPKALTSQQCPFTNEMWGNKCATTALVRTRTWAIALAFISLLLQLLWETFLHASFICSWGFRKSLCFSPPFMKVHHIIQAKLSYFTNLDFPKIRKTCGFLALDVTSWVFWWFLRCFLRIYLPAVRPHPLCHRVPGGAIGQKEMEGDRCGIWLLSSIEIQDLNQKNTAGCRYVNGKKM